MRILLATDGSDSSAAAVREVAKRVWPEGSVVRVVSVIDLAGVDVSPFAPVDPHLFGELERTRRGRAAAVVARAESHLADGPGCALFVETDVLVGPTGRTINEEAERWCADLVVVGSRGTGTIGRTLLGSVSASVAVNAPCSVEIVREARVDLIS